MLYVIAAPSGAGKTTIVKELLKRNGDLVFSVSATTRKKRSGEQDGIDYFFLSKDDFRNKIDSGALVEFELLFNGEYYGTLKSVVDENLRNGKDMIFDIDVNGALSLKKIYGDKAKLFFIMPPDISTLKKRLAGRGTESDDEISERIQRAQNEIGLAEKFDEIIVNDELIKAVNEIEKLIQK